MLLMLGLACLMISWSSEYESQMDILTKHLADQVHMNATWFSLFNV